MSTLVRAMLKKYYNIEIELLLTHVLKKPKEFLYMEPKYKLTIKQINKLTTLIKRRLAGEPIAYILGYKDFYGFRFKVNKNVLIPRPETELVIDCIVRACREQNFIFSTRSKTKILDIGTGSGCIAISLAKLLPATSYQLLASDISPNALKVAKQNAKTHKVKIKFIESDLLKDIKVNPDIIIANLPYGWHGVKNRFSSVKDGLKFEPQNALYTKEKGLHEIRRLLEQICQKESQPKLIYLEFDPRQKNDLAKLIKKILPNYKTNFLKDLNNFWRYAEIEKNADLGKSAF